MRASVASDNADIRASAGRPWRQRIGCRFLLSLARAGLWKMRPEEFSTKSAQSVGNEMMFPRNQGKAIAHPVENLWNA